MDGPKRDFKPELGQMMFGQPTQTEGASYEMEAALAFLSELMPSDKNPFSNSGERLDNSVFSAHAYSWDNDEKQEWNFKWRDIRVSWYKYQGRGMSCNRVVHNGEVAQMVIECAAWIKAEYYS